MQTFSVMGRVANLSGGVWRAEQGSRGFCSNSSHKACMCSFRGWGMFHGGHIQSKSSVSKLGSTSTQQKISHDTEQLKCKVSGSRYCTSQEKTQILCQVLGNNYSAIQREIKLDLKKKKPRLILFSIIHKTIILKELCKQIKTYICVTKFYSFILPQNWIWE
jgi:hypothetical protein